MAKVIEEDGVRISDPNTIVSKVRQYFAKKRLVDEYTAELKDEKTPLFDFLDEHGVEDSSGSRWHHFDEPIDGIIAIQKQRRTSRKLADEESAIEKLRELGLGDRVLVTTVTIDQEALFEAHLDGLISQEDIEEMFPETETFALIAKKAPAPRKGK